MAGTLWELAQLMRRKQESWAEMGKRLKKAHTIRVTGAMAEAKASAFQTCADLTEQWAREKAKEYQKELNQQPVIGAAFGYVLDDLGVPEGDNAKE